MHADGAFRMGKTHSVCQDYVLARSGEPAQIRLADGCSSSPDTDIGARLLARLAAQAGCPGDGAGSGDERLLNLILQARGQAKLLGLEDRALDATLLEIRVEKDAWTAELYGDGVLAWADHADCVHAVSLTYTAGYPCYLNYLADSARRAGFLAQAGNARECEEIVLLPGGEVRPVALTQAPGDSPCYRRTGRIQQTRWVAVLSDGVHSFVRNTVHAGHKVTAPIPWPQALYALTGFKNVQGAFVQRRMNRFLQECEARGWQHRDDIALGAVAPG